MYEYSQRISQNCPGVKGIQGQAKCLLAAMNALRIGDPKFAWVEMPVVHSDDDDDVDDDIESPSPPKRPCGSAAINYVSIV